MKAKRLLGIPAITLLGTAGGENLYRVGEQSGHACYGAGRAGAAWPLGRVACRIAAPYFPSPEKPILDLSSAGMDRGRDSGMHFIGIAGVAADGVATIAVLDENGAVLERLPVRENIYGAASLPTRTALSLEALDAGGHVLARIP